MADPHGQSEKGLLDPNNETCFTLFLFFVFSLPIFQYKIEGFVA